MPTKWDYAKQRRYQAFRRELRKLARKHSTTVEALARVLSDNEHGHDWRALYQWVESPEFFSKAAQGKHQANP